MQLGFLKFEEQFMERLWGGTQLTRVFGKFVPPHRAVGESWLISDHVLCQSKVCEGPYVGTPLHAFLENDSFSLLGSNAHPTKQGRFPLLLKLIDAGEDLSVQVHPDDEQAVRLGEMDCGKTEMWYVLAQEGNCRIIAGLKPGVTKELLQASLENGCVENLMVHFPVQGGEAFFIPAGTIHAIGKGALIAEIQQNSDITYRLYDYNRLDSYGNPRELHVEKALPLINFEATHVSNPVIPLRYVYHDTQREVLAACRYFAAEKVTLKDSKATYSKTDSFRILLAVEGTVTLESEDQLCLLKPGEAVLVPASIPKWSVKGFGTFLEYYVPDLLQNIIFPLRNLGFSDDEIIALGGPPARNDLLVALKREKK